MNDPVAGAKTVNLIVPVSGQELLRRLQGRLDEVLRERGPMGKTVKAMASAVRVQRNDSVKGMRHQFGLQQFYLGLVRAFPKLPVEVLARARAPRAVLETRRVAEGINEKTVARGRIRRLLQHDQEIEQGVGAFGLVTMDTGEEPEAQGFASPGRADEQAARQVVTLRPAPRSWSRYRAPGSASSPPGPSNR